MCVCVCVCTKIPARWRKSVGWEEVTVLPREIIIPGKRTVNHGLRDRDRRHGRGREPSDFRAALRRNTESFHGTRLESLVHANST